MRCLLDWFYYPLPGICALGPHYGEVMLDSFWEGASSRQECMQVVQLTS